MRREPKQRTEQRLTLLFTESNASRGVCGWVKIETQFRKWIRERIVENYEIYER